MSLVLVTPVVVLNLSDFGPKSSEEYCRETWSLLNSAFSMIMNYSNSSVN